MKSILIILVLLFDFFTTIIGQVYTFYIKPDFYSSEIYFNHVKSIKIDLLAHLQFDSLGRFSSNSITLTDKHIEEIVDYDTTNRIVTYKLIDSQQGTFINRVNYVNLPNLIRRTNIDFILDPKFKTYLTNSKIYDTIYIYKLTEPYYHFDKKRIDTLTLALYYALIYSKKGKLEKVTIHYIGEEDYTRKIDFSYPSKKKSVVYENQNNNYTRNLYTIQGNKINVTVETKHGSRIFFEKRICWFNNDGLIDKEVHISSIGTREKTKYRYEKY